MVFFPGILFNKNFSYQEERDFILPQAFHTLSYVMKYFSFPYMPLGCLCYPLPSPWSKGEFHSLAFPIAPSVHNPTASVYA